MAEKRKKEVAVQVDLLNHEIVGELLERFDGLYLAVGNMLNQGYFLTPELVEEFEEFQERLRNPYDDDEWVWE